RALPAGRGYDRARGQDAGTLEEPGLDRHSPGRLEAPGIAHGREALLQRLLDVGRDPQDMLDERIVPLIAVRADEREVHVRVGEAGHEGAAGPVDLAGLAGGAPSAGRFDPGDAAPADGHVVPP